MNMHAKKSATLTDRIQAVGERLRSNGEEAERKDQYPLENLALLKEMGIFSGLVPREYGGEGAHYAEVARALFDLAQHHPSTALTCSMHQHIIAANLFNDQRGKPGRACWKRWRQMNLCW